MYVLYLTKNQQLFNSISEDMSQFKQFVITNDATKALIQCRENFLFYSVYILFGLSIFFLFLNAAVSDFGPEVKRLNLIIKLNSYYFNFYYLNVLLNILFYFVFCHILFMMINSAWIVALVTSELHYQLVLMNSNILEYAKYCE